jgi:hypothetical protein
LLGVPRWLDYFDVKTYYALYYISGKKKRISLETTSRQIAKEKLRQLEPNLPRGAPDPMPTKTPYRAIRLILWLVVS